MVMRSGVPFLLLRQPTDALLLACPASTPLCLCHRDTQLASGTPPLTPLCRRRKQRLTTASWQTSHSCAGGGSCGGMQAPALEQVRAGETWHGGCNIRVIIGSSVGEAADARTLAAPAARMKLCSLLVPPHPCSTCPALKPDSSMLTSHCRCGAPWRGRRPKKAPSATSFRCADCACGILLVCCKLTAGIFPGGCKHAACESHAWAKGAVLKIPCPLGHMLKAAHPWLLRLPTGHKRRCLHC